MYNTLMQGFFISDGTAQEIPLRAGVTHMTTLNWTVANTDQVAPIGVKFEWALGMGDDHAVEYKKSDAANAANLIDAIHTGGFTPYDSTVNTPGLLHTDITAVSNAAIPVVTTTGAHGLSDLDTVRLYNIVGGQQLGAIDFTIGYLTANTFNLKFMAQIAAATTGSFRRVNPTSYWYPKVRYITKVTQAAQAVITLSVSNSFTIGQQVRVTIPSIFGMTLKPTQATILAVDAVNNTITVDINTTALDPFVFPTTAMAATAFSPAIVAPIGENTALAYTLNLDSLEDATQNIGEIGMRLAAGADSPAGQNGDLIYWFAETTEFVNL